ncbi:hypothetical protein [Rhizobium sp. SYY.PMSO]|uniref:hypothetical protein n=1 Tax=Rhizobium sp. SYY.PMSO TaxID=3382192 RepID=UPI00398FD450
MKYLILLLNVLGFWLMADAAHAEPISLAITSIAGFFSSIGAIGKLVLTVAINIGLSLVEKALAKKDQPQPAGTKLEISMGDDHPMSFIIGSYATAGKRKYAGTWGDDGKTPNAYFTDVIEIGSLPNRAGERGLTSVWIDDQKVGVLWEEPHPDGRGFPVLQYRANGKDYLWIKFLDGTQTSPDPFLTAKFGSHAERPWKPTMIGRGCQVVILTSRYNTDLFSGVPSGLFEPHPLPLYDIRKDSSVGGNGVQRWSDPSTWQPSTNPAVMIYNLARGVYYGAEWVYGGQNIGAFCLPATNWIAAANACDASVKLDDGSSEPAFRAGYDVQCDQEPLDAVSELLKGCNGRMAEVGGIFKMLIGTPGAAVYSFSDDDIIVTEEQDFQPFPSLSATYNAIEATYPEPAEKWATKDAPGRYNTDLEAQDGNRRLPAQIQLLAVPFANQVQRVGLAMIQDYRRFRVHQVSLPPDAYPLEPNDVVSWSSVRNGYEEKKFLVVKVEPQPNFLIVVTLKEVDPADYDWHAGLQLPTAIGWLGPITPPSQPMIGWTVEPSTIKDSGGIDRRPAIKVSCAPDLDDVRGVWVQVRLKDTGDVVFDSDSNPYASPYSWLISGQWTLPNTDYEARGRYLPESNRATDWSAWLTVKTPNVLIQAADVLDGAIIQSKIAAAAVSAAKIMDAAVSNLKLADQAVSTAKLQVAAVTADVLASGAVISTKLADSAVTAAKLAQGVVDATKLASGIKAVEVVSALPSTGNVEGRQVFLTTDGKLYRYHNNAWTTAVASADINGTLTDAQIAAVAASKVTGQLTDAQIAAVAAAKVTGTLVSSQIADAAVTNSKLAALAVDVTKLADASVTAAKIADAAVSTTKFANGIRPVEIVAALPTTGNIEGRTVYLTTDDKLYRYTGSAWTSATPAADITGQLSDAQIAAVAAAKVTGTLVSSQIADAAVTNSKLAALAVDATKLADASVTAAKIADAAVSTTKFANGIRPVEIVATLPTMGNIEGRTVYLTTDDKLYRYTGSAWTSATPSTDITGQLTDAQIAAVAAAKVTGQITSTQITDGAISTPKLAAGAVTANELAANSVVAAKIAANAIVAAAISAGAVTTNAIAAGAVTTSQIAANTITAGQIAAGAIGATQIAADAVTTAKIAAGAVTASELAANAVTAGKIAANAIVATNIAAGAITADKMVLADFTNRCENPNFGEGDVGWVKAAGVTIVNDPANAYAGNWYMNFSSATGTGITRNNNVFPVNPGEQYFLQAFVKATGAPDRSLGFRIRYEAADKSTGVASGTIAIPTTVGATYTEFSAAFTVPANAVYAWVDFTISPYAISTGSYQVGFVSCQRRNTGNLIVDGAITAVKIAANAVTAASIAAGAVTATTIASGAITAEKIAANTITAGQIAAGAIGATQIAADAVTTAKIAAGAVTTSELAANAITAGKIAANAVVAGNVAANAITARELILQDWENLVPDNQLQSPASWSSLNSSVVNPSTTQAFTSKGAIDYTYVAGAGYLQILQSQPFAIVSGQPYLASAQAIRTSGTMYGLWLRIHWLDASGNLLSPDTYVTVVSYGTAGGGTAAGMQTFSAEITPPAAAYGAIVRGYIQRDYTDGNVSIGGISFLRKATANLIVDGTITGAKIAATTITAAQIAAGAITATQLAAGAVTTAKIASGAITTVTIAAGAVTANELAANAVTAGKIAANAVTAGTIAAGAVSAAQIAAGAITADKLASNSVTTNALAVGSGENLLQNANFAAGTDCWNYVLGGGSGAVTFALRQPPASWSGAAQPTLMVDKESGPDTGSTYVDVRWMRPDAASLTVANLKYGVPCTAGESFEATAYIAAHRCVCELRIEWRDATGTVLGYSSADTNNAVQSSSTDPDAWPRLRAVGVAPANAVCAGIHIRKRDTNTGQTTSYMFVNKPMLCRIPAGATEPTPWSDGGVVLITPNGIVANAVTADNIAANAITAGKIAANAVTAGTIAAGAVTATTIAAGTITGDKLAANTIGADQIAANAITAKQLVLTDFSNMADNGWQTGTLDGWVIQNQQNFYNDTSSGDVAGWILQSNGRDLARSNYVAVSAGETYAFDVWVYNTDPGNANVYAGLLTPAGVWSPLNVPGATTSVKNTWVRLQGRVTIPSGYAKASMLLQVDKTAGTGGTSYWSKPVMRRAVSAELIVDGAITANKIAANAVTAAQIAAGAVTTDKLILGGVTYDKIASGAVTAVSAGRNAGGQTIGSDQTVNLAACGITVEGDGRVMISAMTLGQYNKNGNSQNAQPIGCNIFRDGTAIFSQTYYLGVVQTIVANGSGGNGGSNSYTYTAGMVAVPALYHAPGAGYHTYTLQIYCPNNTIAWNESNIIATAFKR